MNNFSHVREIKHQQVGVGFVFAVTSLLAKHTSKSVLGTNKYQKRAWYIVFWRIFMSENCSLENI